MPENIDKTPETIRIPGIVNFRLCKLSDHDLMKKISLHLESMYKTGKLPPRHIPARLEEDFDLLVGELMVRYLNKENVEIPIS
jgi:hypothetical protein